MEQIIPFNKPFLTGNETENIIESVNTGKISGNGYFTQKCQSFFEKKYGFQKCLLTTSCTDALEMAAILVNIQPGDEVIVPSYTFVSTANAFVLRGAKIVFAESRIDHPGIDEGEIEKYITNKTKAIVPVHYAGVACDMDKIMDIAEKYNLFVIEDAAQAIDNYYIDRKGEKRPLGSIGHLATFSFHETKNIISGEGGMLVINDNRFVKRAEIIWEKGTNRSSFFRGEIDKYGWVDLGSSFLPSEIISAFLYAQLCSIERIQNKRKELWDFYQKNLNSLEVDNKIKIQKIPKFSENNAHMFYILLQDLEQRNNLIQFLKSNGILAVFHYISLHSSSYHLDNNKNIHQDLPNSDYYSDVLLRLPLFFELEHEQILFITELIKKFFDNEIN